MTKFNEYICLGSNLVSLLFVGFPLKASSYEIPFETILCLVSYFVSPYNILSNLILDGSVKC